MNVRAITDGFDGFTLFHILLCFQEEQIKMMFMFGI